MTRHHILAGTLVTCAVLVSGLLFFEPAFAQYGLQTTAQTAGLAKETGGGLTLPVIIGNVIGTALSLIGIVFFALMVYGGFLWMTARGNDDQTKKALGTITAAVIGLIIILASYAVTQFVLGSVKQTQAPAASNGGAGGGGASAQGQCVETVCSIQTAAAELALETGENPETACSESSGSPGCTWDAQSKSCVSPNVCQFNTPEECNNAAVSTAGAQVCQWKS